MVFPPTICWAGEPSSLVDKVQLLRLGMGNVGQTRSLLSQILLGNLGHSGPLRFVAEWNRTGADSPRRLCVHKRIKVPVERTPESTAVVFHGEPFTHAELGSRRRTGCCAAHYTIAWI